MRKKGNLKEIAITLIILIILINLINLLLVSPESRKELEDKITGQATASNSGVASLCINHEPNITAIADQQANSGSLFSYQVIAADSDAGSFIHYYDNTSLFEIGRTTGLISFTPSAGNEGTYNIKITAADSANCTNSNISTTFTLTIISSEVAGGNNAAQRGGEAPSAEAPAPSAEPSAEPSVQAPSQPPSGEIGEGGKKAVGEVGGEASREEGLTGFGKQLKKAAEKAKALAGKAFEFEPGELKKIQKVSIVALIIVGGGLFITLYVIKWIKRKSAEEINENKISENKTNENNLTSNTETTNVEEENNKIINNSS